MSETRLITAASTLSRIVKGCAFQTDALAKSCAEGRRFFSLGENKAHPLWLLGHLANTGEYLGNRLVLGNYSGAIPKDWAAKFTPNAFGGNPISTNPSDYPAFDEILEAYNKVFSQFVDGITKLTDEQLLGPPAGTVPPPLASRIKTLQDCITLHIYHDSHHRGQMALLINAPAK